MKRIISGVLTLCLLSCLLFSAAFPASANSSGKEQPARTIAIVFDNSGSMYQNNNQAWCRATYAMEVFASMLNQGDTLMIYPMHPITVDGNEYTRSAPLKITDSSQSSLIRRIYTNSPSKTPIECIDAAAQGLRDEKTAEKWMIILTDGSQFDQNGVVLSNTASALGKRISGCLDDMNVLFLGIGKSATLPTGVDAPNYLAEKAEDTKDVLSDLTYMCNLIFGRDTLPAANNSNGKINFDISMKKLIVFVQGENVSNVQLSGGDAMTACASAEVKYAENGCNRNSHIPVSDTSLQGMLVTYENCPAGNYTVNYSGTASSIDVYYEPDADLDFVFTDESGVEVDPKSELYEGNYKVSYGLKDARTGKLIFSSLLGSPEYNGFFSLKGKGADESDQSAISHTGMNGEVNVTLKVGDVFYSKLSVSYLSGYKITKDTSDFNWPENGLTVAPKPAGELRLEISGGDEKYCLPTLEQGSPYIAKIFYQGTQLNGDALESADLRWNPDTSNAEIKKDFQGDHYNLILQYKDENSPQSTVCGECSVIIQAVYTAEGSSTAYAESPMSYVIEDKEQALQVTLSADDYYVISKLDEADPIRATITMNGTMLSDAELEQVQFVADCGGIEFSQKQLPGQSAYLLYLKQSGHINEGDYTITCEATAKDEIGRSTTAKDEIAVTMNRYSMWVKWVAGGLLLLIFLAIVLAILHIKALPKKLHVNKRDCSMSFDGEDVTKNAGFLAKLESKSLNINSKYGGKKVGLLMDVRPGKESYLKTPQGSRTAEVTSASVRKQGNATVQEATLGAIRYVLNEDTHKLERMPKSDKPFLLKNGTRIAYSGVMQSNGEPKPFSVVTKLNFKKK